MKHADHVALLRDGIPQPGGTWADIGAGTGAFTLALADLIGPGATIYAVDRDAGALRSLDRAMREQFQNIALHVIAGDFTRSLALPPLDGIVMANALHFIRDEDKPGVLRRLKGYLKPGGRLIVVEYNVDRGNMWVPYPFSYGRWETLARQAGFEQTRALAAAPSSFLREFYSAISC